MSDGPATPARTAPTSQARPLRRRDLRRGGRDGGARDDAAGWVEVDVLPRRGDPLPPDETAAAERAVVGTSAAGTAPPAEAAVVAPVPEVGASARILEWPGARRPDPPSDDVLPARASRAVPGRAVLVPAAVVLIVWALACLVDGGEPELLDRALMAAAAASPFAVVVAIPVVALAVRARLWVTAAVAALAAAVPWLFVLGYAVPGAGGAAAGARLSVMVLDAGGGGADAPSVVAAVARQPVDVLVVTETSSLLTHELTTAGLDPRLVARWAALPGGDPRAGLCVYSRYRVTRVGAVGGTRWPAVRIELDTGRGIVTVVAGRTSPPGDGTSVWRSDLRTLAAAAGGAGPSVLAGTLDAVPEQAGFRRLSAEGLRDAPAVLGRGVRPTWPSWSPLPLVPLDHVLVGGGVGVRSVGTLAVAGTSHRALVADLVVPSTHRVEPGAD